MVPMFERIWCLTHHCLPLCYFVTWVFHFLLRSKTKTYAFSGLHSGDFLYRSLGASNRLSGGGSSLFASFKVDSHITRRAHAVPLPCHAAKGLERVFRIWFTTVRPCLIQTCHALTMPWPWEERHGQNMAWAQHGKCESDTAALCKSNGKDTF